MRNILIAFFTLVTLSASSQTVGFFTNLDNRYLKITDTTLLYQTLSGLKTGDTLSLSISRGNTVKIYIPAGSTNSILQGGDARTADTIGTTLSSSAVRFIANNIKHIELNATNSKDTFYIPAVVSANATTSTPALHLSGLGHTAGSSSTNAPLLAVGSYLNTSSGGGMMTINAPSGWTGFQLQVANNGTSSLQINSAGAATFGSSISAGSTVTATTNITAGASSSYIFSGRSRLSSSADGIITLFNNGSTDFTRLNFGGTTSSFPSLKRTTTGIDVRLADDSGPTTISSSNFIGAVVVSSAATLTLSGNTAQTYVFSGTTTTWTLPAMTGTTGMQLRIKNRGSANITLNSNAGGNDIYTTAATNTKIILPGEAFTFVSDGTYWNQF